MRHERDEAMVIAALCAFWPILMSFVILVQSSQVARGRLQRNQYFGIRTPSTMRSEQAWVAGHRAALRLAPLYVLPTTVTCTALFMAALHAWRTIVPLIGSGRFIATLALAIYTAGTAGRAARSADVRPDDQKRQ